MPVNCNIIILGFGLLQKKTGRPSDIPPDIEAEIMIAGICIDEGYRPLYAMQDYYEYKDLTSIFHHPMKLSQLNDDRFGDFLDDFYNAGPRLQCNENISKRILQMVRSS